jgi:hypothetical protein
VCVCVCVCVCVYIYIVACVRCVTACQVDSCIDLKRGGAWWECQRWSSPSWSWNYCSGLWTVADSFCTEVCQDDYGGHIYDTCQTVWTGMGSSVGKVQGQLSVHWAGEFIFPAPADRSWGSPILLSSAHLELSSWCAKKESLKVLNLCSVWLHCDILRQIERLLRVIHSMRFWGVRVGSVVCTMCLYFHCVRRTHYTSEPLSHGLILLVNKCGACCTAESLDASHWLRSQALIPVLNKCHLFMPYV